MENRSSECRCDLPRPSLPLTWSAPRRETSRRPPPLRGMASLGVARSASQAHPDFQSGAIELKRFSLVCRLKAPPQCHRRSPTGAQLHRCVTYREFDQGFSIARFLEADLPPTAEKFRDQCAPVAKASLTRLETPLSTRSSWG